MNDKELIIALEKFLKAKYLQKNFWQTKVGLIIYKYINARGNFKKAPSGDPRKGYNGMRETLARRDGWRPEEEN